MPPISSPNRKSTSAAAANTTPTPMAVRRSRSAGLGLTGVGPPAGRLAARRLGRWSGRRSGRVADRRPGIVAPAGVGVGKRRPGIVALAWIAAGFVWGLLCGRARPVRQLGRFGGRLDGHDGRPLDRGGVVVRAEGEAKRRAGPTGLGRRRPIAEARLVFA